MTSDFRLCAKIVGGSESSALGNIIMREKLNQRVSFVAFFKVGKKEVSLNSKPIFASLACPHFLFLFCFEKTPNPSYSAAGNPPLRATTVMYFPFPPPFPFPALWCQMRRTLSLSLHSPHNTHSNASGLGIFIFSNFRPILFYSREK